MGSRLVGHIHTYIHTYIRTYIHAYKDVARSNGTSITFNRTPKSTCIIKQQKKPSNSGKMNGGHVLRLQ
jgi:hypothetical protein